MIRRLLRFIRREMLVLDIASMETLLADIETSASCEQLSTELRGRIALARAMLGSDEFNAA